MKKDPIIIFIKNTIVDRNIIGDEQYRIKHNVCIIGLFIKTYFYILDPNSLELSVIINGPIHSPINILVNAYSEVPLVLSAANPAVTSEITNGPHKSHYFCNFL